MPISPRILYVDDDPEGRAFISFWLERDFGLDVVSASDGSEARQFIEQEFFDLYLLDYCLPDVTATSLCKDIKAANPSAPIIVYSALDRDVDRIHAIKAGANSYFVKPDQIDMVGTEIKRLFDNSTRSIVKESDTESRDTKFASKKDRTVCAPHHRRKKAGGIV